MKLFFYIVGDTWKKKNLQIWISQKWFEISILNFHHLLTSIGTRPVPNMKGIAHLKRLPRPWEVQNWNGRSGLNFWATSSKFWEKWCFMKIYNNFTIIFGNSHYCKSFKKCTQAIRPGVKESLDNLTSILKNLTLFKIFYHHIGIFDSNYL